MITVGIETSCDETAVAFTRDGEVLSSEVSSSVHLHSKYGGVIPEIASRFHTEYILPVFTKALFRARVKTSEIGLVAVTKGPGLPGSLFVGLAFAKALALAADIPVIGVDHLKAHIASAFLEHGGVRKMKEHFPFVAMVISGGHTSTYYCKDILDLELIGRTLDDAAGEAFDYAATIMALGYPGGPVIEKRAALYKGAEKIVFPMSLMRESPGVDFSFSGIKTAVLYHWRSCPRTETEINKISNSFQDAVIGILIKKAGDALKRKRSDKLVVGGGVINNRALRERLSLWCEKQGIALLMPEKKYSMDNAAMVALLGEALYGVGERSNLYLNATQEAEGHDKITMEMYKAIKQRSKKHVN